jgi:hypothetical protein
MPRLDGKVLVQQYLSMLVAAFRGTATVAEYLFQQRVYMHGVLAACVQAAVAALCRQRGL